MNLRQLDWRFLLPGMPGTRFGRAALVGWGDGMADVAGAARLADQVICSFPLDHRVDLLAVKSTAAVGLPQIARALAPGALLYWEIDRRSPKRIPLSPAHVRHALERKGLRVLGTYWAKPNLQRYEMLLPLDVDAALRWYVKTLYTPLTHTGAALETLLEVVTGLRSRRFASLAPSFAVIARAPGAEDTRHNHTGSLTDPADLRLGSSILFTDDGDRVVLLPFAAGEPLPAKVVKISKHAIFNRKNENEQQVLEALSTACPMDIRAALPQPMGLTYREGLAVSEESYRPGPWLVRLLASWRTPLERQIHELDRAADWLTRFHAASLETRPWTLEERQRWLDEPLRAYANAFGLSAAERSLFNRATAYAESLTDVSLPISWQHRDFNVWNMFLGSNGISVVDWEGGRRGPVLCDLLHYELGWFHTVRRAESAPDQVAAFERLFCQPAMQEADARAAQEATLRYMAALGIDRRIYPLLLVYTWVELALRAVERAQEREEAIGHPIVGNRYIQYLDVLARSAHWLFGRVI